LRQGAPVGQGRLGGGDYVIDVYEWSLIRRVKKGRDNEGFLYVLRNDLTLNSFWKK
jgi:hypothetical protein